MIWLVACFGEPSAVDSPVPEPSDTQTPAPEDTGEPWWEENRDADGDGYLDDVDEAEQDWREAHPSGFLLPLSYSDDYIEVGPDLF